MVTRLLRITGRVQGVGYRGWMLGQARRLGLSGWVRNRRDGSVEALIGGDEPSIIQMINACQDGPPAARVDAIAQADAPAPGQQGFVRLPTL